MKRVLRWGSRGRELRRYGASHDGVCPHQPHPAPHISRGSRRGSWPRIPPLATHCAPAPCIQQPEVRVNESWSKKGARNAVGGCLNHLKELRFRCLAIRAQEIFLSLIRGI